MTERIASGASIQLVDATGVPLAEELVRGAVGDGDCLAIRLDVVTTRAAEDALLAGILRRHLEDDTTYGEVDVRGRILDLAGSIGLTPRETRWLATHYPQLRT